MARGDKRKMRMYNPPACKRIVVIRVHNTCVSQLAESAKMQLDGLVVHVGKLMKVD